MKHPYIGLPDQQFWKNEPGIKNGSQLDPISKPNFQIGKGDKIVTAGSCFAQHVARFMSGSGYNHFIAEKAHPTINSVIAKKHNYGLFSARYGNIYTARQLKQLLQRAFGNFDPIEVSWPSKALTVVDPFRPQIQPGGFLSEKELLADRAHHFHCIRTAVAEMDVFVFTLGLTECWQDTRDGAVFPLAPGVAGGIYDPEMVSFANFDVEETYADLKEAFRIIREINPRTKIIVTVSPVALNATYESRHVLLSTTWSKSVLRICAEKVTKEFKDCTYFPSYEIITSPHVRGAYFASDCREVTENGVDHVMNLFLKHFTNDGKTLGKLNAIHTATDEEKHQSAMEKVVESFCDEAAIDNS